MGLEEQIWGTQPNRYKIFCRFFSEYWNNLKHVWLTTFQRFEIFFDPPNPLLLWPAVSCLEKTILWEPSSQTTGTQGQTDLQLSGAYLEPDAIFIVAIVKTFLEHI